MFNLHPQTLRLYEREGLLKPSRSQGNTRLYTDEDLRQLGLILNLIRDLGVNLAGVEVILNMRQKIAAHRGRGRTSSWSTSRREFFQGRGGGVRKPDEGAWFRVEPDEDRQGREDTAEISSRETMAYRGFPRLARTSSSTWSRSPSFPTYTEEEEKALGERDPSRRQGGRSGGSSRPTSGSSSPTSRNTGGWVWACST